MLSKWMRVAGIVGCLPGFAGVLLCIAGGGLLYVVQQRLERCAYVPLLAEELLPNADLSLSDPASPLPQGWSAAAPGVQPGTFAVDGDGRSLQLMGIANYIQTPPIPVQPGQSYCFTGMAITDSHQGSTARVRATFRWLDDCGQLIVEERSPWQSAVLWSPDAPPAQWSPIVAAARAPPGAMTMQIRLQPSSDDRLYVDAMHIRQGGRPASLPPSSVSLVKLQPWPAGYRAALSFSFDWETAMGGLVHSRSVDDPYADQDPLQRGLRMREGITTTLALFRPYGIRATYYATGYNFLLGNRDRMQFMGNPTYAWASTANRWLSDRWQTTPWFAPDPYGTVQSDPAWYFGDLVPRLQQEQQDIQSHTFSHFYGGFVGPQDWRADITAWNDVADSQSVPPFRSLAFPWSSSGGMSEGNWRVLEEAGVTSVTRLSDQSQYNLFPQDERGLVREPFCRPLPGHEQILACPDFYLTPASAGRALEQIDQTLQLGGMIDIWAHTEEVITPEQQAAWQHVVDYAAARPDLWVAPLRELARWQQALALVSIEPVGAGQDLSEEEGQELNETNQEPLLFRVTNGSDDDLHGLTLALPFVPRLVMVDGREIVQQPAAGGPFSVRDQSLVLQLPAHTTLEVQVWPAT